MQHESLAKGATILVVEDDRDTLGMLQTVLESAGYRVITASDSHSALADAVQHNQEIESILLDLMIPGNCDGYEVCRRLRADPRTRHIPVIVLSARSSAADMALSYQVGAFQHIVKPYETQHLLAVIERMVRLRRREREAAANAEKYYAIFNHLPLEIIQVGADLRIREMNALFRARFPACQVGDSILTAGFDNPSFEENQHPAARALATGQNHETTVQARRGGHGAYLRISATPLKGDDGAVSGAVVMIDDITAEEQTRQNLQRQIERHTRAMQWQDELAMRLMIYQKELKQKNLELEEAKKELERLSITDPLTLLHNRRYFDNVFPQESRRCSRYNHPLSVLYLDIDHFKHVNDNFGHAAGDAVLKELAVILRTHLRETDTVARHGGEEFVALLPETTIDIAAAIGERLRQAVEKHHFPIDKQQAHSITVSIGAASACGQNIDHQDLLARADAACYRAKAAGRNKVICDTSEPQASG